MKAKELVYSSKFGCTPYLVSVNFNEDGALMVLDDNHWVLRDVIKQWLENNSPSYTMYDFRNNSMFRRIANGEVQVWFFDDEATGKTAREQAMQFKISWNGVDPYDHATRMQS
jgi:DNA-directed RNA polymerase delta subunit